MGLTVHCAPSSLALMRQPRFSFGVSCPSYCSFISINCMDRVETPEREAFVLIQSGTFDKL